MSFPVFSAAEHLPGQGYRVELRDPMGTSAGGGTSDLVINGELWDVYSPTTKSISSILTNVAKKFSQVHGGGVIVDLSRTGLSESAFGGLAATLDRVNDISQSWGKTALIGDVKFFGVPDGKNEMQMWNCHSR